MNQVQIAQSLQDQHEIEQTEEYQFEQRLLVLDEKLAELRATLNRIHAHDRAYERWVRHNRREQCACPTCGRSQKG